MKKLVTILIVLGCLCCGCLWGCDLPGFLQRLGNVPDHCGLVQTDADFFSVGVVCEFAENPAAGLPLFEGG